MNKTISVRTSFHLTIPFCLTKKPTFPLTMNKKRISKNLRNKNKTKTIPKNTFVASRQTWTFFWVCILISRLMRCAFLCRPWFCVKEYNVGERKLQSRLAFNFDFIYFASATRAEKLCADYNLLIRVTCQWFRIRSDRYLITLNNNSRAQRS